MYACLELGIGAIGLLVLFGMPLVGGAYTAWAGGGVVGILLRGVAAAVCLLPPTLLMGATLPAIARWVEATPEGVSWLGFFYGGNTAGAVAGSVLAGYYLLRVFDISITTYVAVGLNVTVALLALLVASRTPYEPPQGVRTVDRVRARGARVVYVVIALSGLTALSAEVIWTRILALVFGATTYTFSLILAVFLAGLGIGSSIGSALARGLKRPRAALAWCQLGLCVSLAWAAYVLTQSLPYWPINPSITTDPWFQFQLDLVRCLYAVLPGAILWGASFPLALASVASRDEDPARMVGGVYAANTLGAIVGSLGASLVLMVWIGSQHAQQVLIVVAALSGLLLLWEEKVSLVAVVAAAAATSLLVLTVHPIPGILVAYGRYSATEIGQSDVIYVGEGWNASVAVSRRSNGVLNYHNAGKGAGLERAAGHAAAAHAGASDDARAGQLEDGSGDRLRRRRDGRRGVDRSGGRARDDRRNRAARPARGLHVFLEHNFDVVRNPKVRVQIDDARHFLFTTRDKFDAITSDPLDPWVKGAAMLYTREFFELVKQHLNPGGVVTLFVQLYESNTEAVKSEIATFFEAFPNGMIFANTWNGQGYDLVLLGQVEPTHIDLDQVAAKLERPEYARVKQSLSEIGMNSVTDLFGTFVGKAADFKPWLADAQINRDRNLRLQYLAGRGLNLYHADAIFSEMLPYGRDPDGIFDPTSGRYSELLQDIHSLQHRD